MLFRFIGQYTHGRTTINAGVDFEGHEPSEVTDAELIRRLSNNPEFDAVEALVEAPIEAPKKRGRPKKVAE
jgi:hypothetical protein